MTEKKERVEFKIIAPEATQVILSGDFNDWSEIADVMKKDDTGTWKKIKILPCGTYEYKFIVDGMWMSDPNCSESMPNLHGSDNSVMNVTSKKTDDDVCS